MTMLHTLEALDKKGRAYALSLVSRNFVPQPRLDPFEDASLEEREMMRRVLAEVRNVLGLPEGDISEKDRTRVVSFLSSKMTEMILEGADIETLRSRLGQRGELNPAYYRGSFSDSFKRDLKRHKVSRKTARHWMTNPDRVQHLSDELPSEHEGRAPTLLAKDNVSASRGNLSTIILAFRNGDTLTAHSLYFLYYKDFPEAGRGTIMDDLRALAEAFGVQARIGDQTGRFFADIHVMSPLGKDHNLIQVVESSPSSTHHIQVVLKRKATAMANVTHIGFAYVIDEAKYKRSTGV